MKVRPTDRDYCNDTDFTLSKDYEVIRHDDITYRVCTDKGLECDVFKSLFAEVVEPCPTKSDFITSKAMESSQPEFIGDIKMDSVDLAISHLKTYQKEKNGQSLSAAMFYIKKEIEDGK